IRLGADWFWLYRSRQNHAGCAVSLWQPLGLDAGRPLLSVNLFWQDHIDSTLFVASLAAALNHLRVRRNPEQLTD
ncbi:MAG TPA: hypothetical protein VFQ91_04195, partial [Bryobacteraceae bacterium]|nr:hypothetical protein [Bryobacteraceae bacterium]